MCELFEFREFFSKAESTGPHPARFNLLLRPPTRCGDSPSNHWSIPIHLKVWEWDVFQTLENVPEVPTFGESGLRGVHFDGHMRELFEFRELLFVEVG